MGKDSSTGEWARRCYVAALVIACGGVEPPPDLSTSAGAGAGSVYVHGSVTCGGESGSASAGASASAGVTSQLPTDFDAGAGNAAGAISGASSGTAGSGGQPSGGAPATQGGAAGAPEPLGHALIFSEYVEGSSTYKALELHALAPSTLTGCRIAIYFNGGTTATGTELEGALVAGQSYVVCSSSLGAMTTSCDRSAGLTYNGDDAISLECDGEVIDSIGQLGVDPGSAWGQGDSSTLDHTLRRRCDAAPDTAPGDAFEPSSAWLGFAQDSFADLGSRDCSSAGGGGGSGGAAP